MISDGFGDAAMTDFKPIAYNVSKASDPDRWHELRRSGIGSSDAPSVCGVSPWGGALGVYLQKKGQTPQKESTEAMMMGELLEEPIAGIFSHKTGFKVTNPGVMLRHPEHSFMLADVDRWVEDDSGKTGVLEIKNVSAHMAKDWDDDYVPDYVKVQVQHQLCVCGLDYAWVAPLIGGNHLAPVKMMRDDRLIAELIKIERRFWDYVETNTPPPIDDSPQAEQVLRLCYPVSEKGKSVTLEGDLEDMAKKLLQARGAEILIKGEIQGYKNRIMEAMADAEAAYLPGQDKPLFTYKGSTTRRLDIGRLALEHPEVAAAYYVESSSRRFLVKGQKEDE